MSDFLSFFAVFQDSDDFDSDNMQEVDLFDADTVPQQRQRGHERQLAHVDSDLDSEVEALQKLKE